MSESDSEEPTTGRRPKATDRPAPTIDLSEREFARESAEAPPAPEPEVETAAPSVEEPVPPAENPPPPRAVPPFLPIAAAGLVGGVIGALLTAFLSSSGPDPVLQASIDSRFAALAGRIDSLGAGLSDVDNRLKELPAGVGSGELSALEQRIGALEIAPAPPAPAQPDLGPIEQRLSALENRAAETAVGQSAANPEIAALSERLDALGSRLDGLVAAPPKDPQTEAAARTIALTALVDAANRGEPFASALSQLRAITGDDPTLAALGQAAERGVPSRTYVASQFPAVAERIRETAARPDPEAGLLDRLSASARSLVSVRPVGPVSGNSATAVVSRMEAAVANGDFEAALAEREALDAAGKAASADWASAAAARVALDREIAALQAKLSGG